MKNPNKKKKLIQQQLVVAYRSAAAVGRHYLSDQSNRAFGHSADTHIAGLSWLACVVSFLAPPNERLSSFVPDLFLFCFWSQELKRRTKRVLFN